MANRRNKCDSPHKQRVQAPDARSMVPYHPVIFKYRKSIHSSEQWRCVYFYSYLPPSPELLFSDSQQQSTCGSMPSQIWWLSVLMICLEIWHLSSTRHDLALPYYFFEQVKVTCFLHSRMEKKTPSVYSCVIWFVSPVRIWIEVKRFFS